MQWHAITGSWRKTDRAVERDVRACVDDILSHGDGIVTGGALGVEYVATQTVLDAGRAKNQIQIYLPIEIEAFLNHYRRRADEEVITREQADAIIAQLEAVRQAAPHAIHDETPYTEANPESYYARNTSIVMASSLVHTFQVNGSSGVQDAIDTARENYRLVWVRRYTID